MNGFKLCMVFSFYLLILTTMKGQELSQGPVHKLKENTTISGQYFMGYYYDTKNLIQNFTLKRGYFGIRTKLNNTFSIRYTQDITLDQEGGDAGNVEIRLKYLYLKGKLDFIPALSYSYFEVGMVHRPWLEFEQHINQFRVQGRMYVEKYDIIGSADFGLTVAGYFGGEIDQEYQRKVNSKETGRYGSFALGVFNGGGYHAIEQNNNKTFESRVTLRPLPDLLPGLQLSHGFAFGLGNVAEDIPEFVMNVFMLSTESIHHKATAQYYFGRGNDAGEMIDELGLARPAEGYSFFGELYLPKTDFSLFGRYDYFSDNKGQSAENKTVIGGIAYRFLKNKVLLDFQRSDYSGSIVNYYELALEIGF
jgi:hypothetical protein